MIAYTLHSCVSRLRDLGVNRKIAYGHAMLFDLFSSTTYGTGGSCINMLAPIAVDAQGISVPISRGGPPIFKK